MFAELCRSLQSAHFATIFFASAVARTRALGKTCAKFASAKAYRCVSRIMSIVQVFFTFGVWDLLFRSSKIYRRNTHTHKINKQGKLFCLIVAASLILVGTKNIKEQTGTLLCLVVAARLTLSLQKTLSCLFCGQLQKQICCYKVHVCRTRETCIFSYILFFVTCNPRIVAVTVGDGNGALIYVGMRSFSAASKTSKKQAQLSLHHRFTMSNER